MTNRYGIVLFLLVASSLTWAETHRGFAIKDSHPDANGVTFQTAGGKMRIEMCGDHVIHVIASPTPQLPMPPSYTVTS